MKKPSISAALFILLSVFGAAALSAQNLSFQYGSIPFGETESYIRSRAGGAEIERKSSPTAQFLSADVIIEKDPENPVYRFFDGGIRKTVSWGDAYVDLYEKYIERVDIRLPGEPKSDLFFYDGKLLLLHKSVRLEQRYREAFAGLIPALSGRIGREPVTEDTRFRGFSYELYSKYAFWEESEVTIYVLVREKSFQSKVSTAEFVYVYTPLWNEYKAAVQAATQSTEDLLDNF